MITQFIEATDSFNWGKFMVARFDAEEWARRSQIAEGAFLLKEIGWASCHILVWDMQTGEGAIFLPGGSAVADLNKHAVWVCPMFEPFLSWLYDQDLSDITALPPMVLLEGPKALAGYRRPGLGLKDSRRKKASCVKG